MRSCTGCKLRTQGCAGRSRCSLDMQVGRGARCSLAQFCSPCLLLARPTHLSRHVIRFVLCAPGPTTPCSCTTSSFGGCLGSVGWLRTRGAGICMRAVWAALPALKGGAWHEAKPARYPKHACACAAPRHPATNHTPSLFGAVAQAERGGAGHLWPPRLHDLQRGRLPSQPLHLLYDLRDLHRPLLQTPRAGESPKGPCPRACCCASA